MDNSTAPRATEGHIAVIVGEAGHADSILQGDDVPIAGNLEDAAATMLQVDEVGRTAGSRGWGIQPDVRAAVGGSIAALDIVADIDEPATYKTQTGIGDDPMTLKYTIKLELKKGRYRYTFDNIQISYTDDNKTQQRTLYDIDKGKGGGLIGVGKEKRMLKAMDALFLKKIDLLTATMSKRSDDF